MDKGDVCDKIKAKQKFIYINQEPICFLNTSSFA